MFFTWFDHDPPCFWLERQLAASCLDLLRTCMCCFGASGASYHTQPGNPRRRGSRGAVPVTPSSLSSHLCASLSSRPCFSPRPRRSPHSNPVPAPSSTRRLPTPRNGSRRTASLVIPDGPRLRRAASPPQTRGASREGGAPRAARHRLGPVATRPILVQPPLPSLMSLPFPEPRWESDSGPPHRAPSRWPAGFRVSTPRRPRSDSRATPGG